MGTINEELYRALAWDYKRKYEETKAELEKERAMREKEEAVSLMYDRLTIQLNNELEKIKKIKGGF